MGLEGICLERSRGARGNNPRTLIPGCQIEVFPLGRAEQARDRSTSQGRSGIGHPKGTETVSYARLDDSLAASVLPAAGENANPGLSLGLPHPSKYYNCYRLQKVSFLNIPINCLLNDVTLFP